MKTVGLRWIALGACLCLGLAAAAWWVTSAPIRTTAADGTKDDHGKPNPALDQSGPAMESLSSAVPPPSVASGDPGGSSPENPPFPRTDNVPASAQGFPPGASVQSAVGGGVPRSAVVDDDPRLVPEAVAGPALAAGAPLAAAVELSPWQSPPVNVPPGERLPALFHDTRPLPAPQRQALDSIANDFIDAVGVGDPAGSTSDPAEVWEAARAEADRRYIILYGFQQYDQLHRAAALEGLREKKALSRPNP